MTHFSCSLWILTARTDLPFLAQTIPHLVRMCNYPFQEKVLALDTAPLTGDKVNRPGIGSLEDLRRVCRQLQAEGWVDRIVEINYDRSYQNQVYRKHFGYPLHLTHNYKGYPILGTIFTLESAQSDYVLHFDSDMLLYQAPNFSWIDHSIELMENHPQLMSLRPLTGPPSIEGRLEQNYPYTLHPEGFYCFKFFSSRAYLIKKERFDRLLPLPILWRPYRQSWVNTLPLKWKNQLHCWTGKGKLDSWEIMVSQQLEKTDFVRGTLSNPKAWTVHPVDRSQRFLSNLPQIIQRIEQGDYPPAQAGYYDLQTDLWV